MNSTFAIISILVKSNIEGRCPINFLMNVSTKALRDYLECANIYKGTSPINKTNLIEMIIYGCITEKIDKKEIEDISIKQANQILKKKQYNSKIIAWICECWIKKKRN